MTVADGFCTPDFRENSGAGKRLLKETELLSQWIKVGQEVVYVKPLQQGARVVEFGRKYIQRGSLDHKRAGTYIDFEYVRVVMPDGTIQTWRAEPFYYFNTPSPTGDVPAQIKELKVRIGDLPDTPFWVGDKVRVCRHHARPICTVTEVYYGGTPATPEPIYRSCNETYQFNEPARSLELVDHGDIWKLEHGEPLSFTDIEEEALFYKSLGMSQKVPREGADCIWQLWAAVQAIQQGRADRYIPKDRKKQQVVLIKYDNRAFGERMRKHVLEPIGMYLDLHK